MAIVGDATFLVRADDTGFEGDLNSRVGGSVRKIAGLAAGVLAGVGLTAFFKDATNAAADLGEAQSLTNAIFGEGASSIVDSFAANADAIGQSEAAARSAASTFGGLLQNMGFTADEAARSGVDLTKLASDLGSAFNTEPADAVQAIGAALRGESEPIRRYNILLSQEAIAAKAVELGLAETTKEVDANAKAQAALALISEQTTKVQGDFARTQDGLPNTMRRAKASFEDFQATIASGLAPVLATLVDSLAPLLPALTGPLTTLAGAIGEIIVALSPILGILPPIADLFARLASVIAEQLTDVLGEIIPEIVAVIEAFSPFIDIIGTLVGTLISALLPVLSRVLTAIAPLIEKIGLALIPVIESLVPIIEEQADAFVLLLDALLPLLPPLVDLLLAFLPLIPVIVQLSTLWVQMLPAIMPLIEAFTQLVTLILTKLTPYIASLSEWLAKRLAPDLEKTGEEVARVADFMTTAIEVVKRFASTIGDLIGEAVDLRRTLIDAGRDLIDGFIKGIQGAAGRIIRVIKENVTDKLPEFVKDALGIASPSRVFEALGAQIPAGLAKGIASGSGLVDAAVAAMLAETDQRPGDVSVGVPALTPVGAGATDVSGSTGSAPALYVDKFYASTPEDLEDLARRTEFAMSARGV